MEKRWQRGDTVVMRDPLEERMVRAYQAVMGDDPTNIPGWPHVVLEDSDERVSLYLPEGTKLWRWNVREGRFREPRVTQGDSIRLFFPGKPYEVSLFFDTGSGPAPWVEFLFPGVRERFYGWKVDVTSPFARTDVGFDVIDEVLDIMITPDRSYRWKDEDQMAAFVELGIYTAADAEALHAIGEGVIDMVKRHEPPFDDEWQSWLPDSDLKLAKIADGWQYLAVPPPYKTYDLNEDMSARFAAAERWRLR